MIEIKYPDGRGKEYVEFYGYLLYPNGTFISRKTGKVLNRITQTEQNSHVNIFIDDYKYKINIARTVYIVFSGNKIDRNTIIEYKDGNHDNKDFSNLTTVSRQEHFIKVYTPVMNKKIQNNKTMEEIRAKYKTGTQVQLNKKGLVQKGIIIPSYRSLAKEYGCSTSIIQKIINYAY